MSTRRHQNLCFQELYLCIYIERVESQRPKISTLIFYDLPFSPVGGAPWVYGAETPAACCGLPESASWSLDGSYADEEPELRPGAPRPGLWENLDFLQPLSTSGPTLPRRASTWDAGTRSEEPCGQTAGTRCSFGDTVTNTVRKDEDRNLFSFSRWVSVLWSCSLSCCSKWDSRRCCPHGESWSRAGLDRRRRYWSSSLRHLDTGERHWDASSRGEETQNIGKNRRDI